MKELNTEQARRSETAPILRLVFGYPGSRSVRRAPGSLPRFSIASPVFLDQRQYPQSAASDIPARRLAVGATYVLIIAEVDLSVGSLYGFAGMVGGHLIVSGVPEIATIPIVLLLGARDWRA